MNLPKIYYCKRCNRFTDVRYVSDKFGGRNKSYCYKCAEEMLEPCYNIIHSSDISEFNIYEIRKAIGELAWAINRQRNRNLMPYDWYEYGHLELLRLCNLGKVDTLGKLKKKDKRGTWR